MVQWLKTNLPANAGDRGSIPGLGRSPGEGNGNPIQYSCLGNPMNRGAWWAIVHRVAKSWKDLQLNKNKTKFLGRSSSKALNCKILSFLPLFLLLSAANADSIAGATVSIP